MPRIVRARECPVCEKLVVINKTGEMRKHGRQKQLDGTYSFCPGEET